MKWKWLLRCLPFVLVCVIHVLTWLQLLSGANEPVFRHYLALLLVVINGFLYFKKPHKALLLTALILVLSALNLIELYTYVNRSSLIIVLAKWELSTPGLQWHSVGLLLIYLLCTGRYWVNTYMDKKYGKIELEERL